MKKTYSILLSAALATAAFSAVAGGNIESGKALAAKYSCASCHGADYNTPVDPSYPKLAGQHADYLQNALIAYKRGNDSAYGRGNAIMGGMAKPLSTRDISDISAYLASLQGGLVKVK